MKKALIILAAFVLFVMLGTGLAAADEFTARQAYQMGQIDRGVANGTISRYEARALTQEQERLRMDYLRSSANGRVQPQERQLLSMKQQLAEQHIYRLQQSGNNMQHPGINNR